jgi:chlorite dismutase
MERRTPPPTEEGWFALHDFRTVDWEAWRDAPERERERALEEGSEMLAGAEAINDAEEGASATYAVLGNEADLLVMHLRPTTAAVDTLHRRFEGTGLAQFTERAYSYVSVTEASGYSERAREYFEGEVDETSGLARYIDSRLAPTVPDAEHVCFYPMDKRRDSVRNWYDLPFAERAEHMASHGEVGREYGGTVTQMITGSMGFDDHEWGVTLWADDAVQIKQLLYDMRFDPSTSKFAEFGPFYLGRRLPPADLGSYLAGEHVPSEEGHAGAVAGGDDRAGRAEHSKGDQRQQAGPTEAGPQDGEPADGAAGGPAGGDEDLREQLETLGVYAGQPRGEEVFALVVYTDAAVEAVFEEVRGLRANFDHYDTHVETAVYTPEGGDGDVAVASLWETESAAETAAGFLSDLPGTTGRAGEADGWSTMGMFYQVEDDHREAFLDTFEEVGAALAEMDGHRETRLLVDHEDDCAMFIDSRWDGREDATAFFRSEEFRDTVEWGREVLADRPRHVFLA